MARPTLDRAHRAVLGVFALAGLVFAAWASRIADAKVALDLGAGELGTTLLFLSVGSLIALPSAGRVIDRFGVVPTIRIGTLVAAVGLLGVGLGVAAGERWFLAPALVLIGVGVSVWDVAMNLEGTVVERHLGRTVMPHYHAAFSAATVVGALIGSAASWARVPLWLHLGLVGLFAILAGTRLLAAFLPEEDVEDASADAHRPDDRSPWLERRTLVIGCVMLAAAFAEGVANDWLSVAFVEGHGLEPWAGILALATFLAFMTVGRVLGTGLLDRHGRVPVLLVLFVLAAIGAALVVFGPVWAAFVGAAVWGVGASLGFPVGMSASADDPRRASARMATVATMGYAAFIAGPPLLGYLGDQFGVLQSLLVVGAMSVLALAAVPAVREQRA